jgi:hypothetical protein
LGMEEVYFESPVHCLLFRISEKPPLISVQVRLATSGLSVQVPLSHVRTFLYICTRGRFWFRAPPLACWSSICLAWTANLDTACDVTTVFIIRT